MRRAWVRWGCLPASALLVLVLAAVAIIALRDTESDPTSSAVRPTTGQDRGSSTTVAAPSTAPGSTPSGATPPGSIPGVATESCRRQQGIIERDCAVFRPTEIASGERLPLVILLHGFATGPSEIRANGGWLDQIVARRFVLASPQGVADSWNAGDCCGLPKLTGIDDVGYLRSLITELGARPDVDPDRVMLAGHSNGGMLLYRLTCDPELRVAALASVAGSDVSGCVPVRPVRTLHIHGTGDLVVPYDGSENLASALLGADFPPVSASMDARAATQQCGSPTDEVDGPRSIRRWVGCAEGTEIELITLSGVGHDWMRAPVLDATSVILDFFGIPPRR